MFHGRKIEQKEIRCNRFLEASPQGGGLKAKIYMCCGRAIKLQKRENDFSNRLLGLKTPYTICEGFYFGTVRIRDKITYPMAN